MQALILAAGKGTRMRSSCPKVLHEILGRPILDYVLRTLTEVGTKKITVVIGSGAERVHAFLKSRQKDLGCSISVVLQKEQKGTGHAVQMAAKHFAGSREDLLIWPGDMPLVKRETIENFVGEHKKSGADASVLSALRLEPAGYGRILRAGGQFYAIREELDASDSERRIQEVNTGIYLFRSDRLFSALKKIKPSNQKKELYLTDTIEVLAKENGRIAAFPLALGEEGQGINSRIDLGEATQKMQNREVLKHQENGVTFVSPAQTFIEPGVQIGPDTTIYPWCYIESNVKIGSGCQIGPFAKIRKGSEIGDDAIVGSFVEINRSKLANGVAAKHLAYLGDAVIGEDTNIGAGTITANFDGEKKHTTRIGKKVLVGSNTVFVAPVEIEDGARTGAGSVLTAGTKVKKGQIVAGVPAKLLKK